MGRQCFVSSGALEIGPCHLDNLTIAVFNLLKVLQLTAVNVCLAACSARKDMRPC